MVKVYGLLSYLCGSVAIALLAVALMAGGGQMAMADPGCVGCEFGSGYLCTDSTVAKTCICQNDVGTENPQINMPCRDDANHKCKESNCTCRKDSTTQEIFCSRPAAPPPPE